MSNYRKALPQVSNELFMTDGGLETTLIYHDGVDLPLFAAFHLLRDAHGTAVLRRYFDRYARIAQAHGLPIVLESPTWRANAEWGARLGYDADALARANRQAIELMREVRDRLAASGLRSVISGNIGPRGDGYRPDSGMSPLQAYAYHAAQVSTFARTEADMVAAFTMNYVEEAIGIATAAKMFEMPVAISFTVETDGRLPSGQPLTDAIAQTDDETSGHPAYYMINCAHPTHFAHVLRGDLDWLERIRGIRANASMRSHAELDASTDLDAGDPERLGAEYGELAQALPHLSVVGGCCGTDHRHIDAICAALAREVSIA